MRLFLLCLCYLLVVTSASAETTTVSRGQVFLGGNRIDATRVSRMGTTITVNDYVIFPRRCANVTFAPVTTSAERIHQLHQTLFAHPEWTTDEAAAFFRQATDVVSNAWAESASNQVWVQFRDRVNPTAIDRTPSTAADPESTMIERYQLIIATLNMGGQIYAGDDYTIYVPSQQVADVNKQFTTPAARDARFVRRFQAAIRDQRQPRSLETYRVRR